MATRYSSTGSNSWFRQKGNVAELPSPVGNDEYWRKECEEFLRSQDAVVMALVVQHDDQACCARLLKEALDQIAFRSLRPDADAIMASIETAGDVVPHVARDGEPNALGRVRVFQGFVVRLCHAYLLRYVNTKLSNGGLDAKHAFRDSKNLGAACATVIRLLDLHGILHTHFDKRCQDNSLPVNGVCNWSAVRDYSSLLDDVNPLRELLKFVRDVSDDIASKYAALRLYQIARTPSAEPAAPVARINSSVRSVLNVLQPEEDDTKAGRQELEAIKALLAEELKVEVYEYGSMVTGLAEKSSDWDTCVLMQELLMTEAGRDLCKVSVVKSHVIANMSMNSDQHSQDLTAKACVNLTRLLSRVLENEYEVEGIHRARKPLVRLSKLNVSTPFSVDVCLSRSPVSLCNSALLKHYCNLDSRFAQLTIIVKAWSKNRMINGAYHSHLSSYAFTLSVLTFLIHHKVLPNIQMPDKEWNEHFPPRPFSITDETLCQDPHVDTHDLPWSSYRSPNRQTVGELLLEYIKFILFEVDWNDHILSPRTAPLILQKSKFIATAQPYTSPRKQKSKKSDQPIQATDYPTSSVIQNFLQSQTSDSTNDWLYQHPAHSFQKYLVEHPQDNGFYQLMVECPCENGRYIKTRYMAGNWQLYAEFVRAWCILSTTGDVNLMLRKMPMREAASQSCELRQNAWNSIRRLRLEPDRGNLAEVMTSIHTTIDDTEKRLRGATLSGWPEAVKSSFRAAIPSNLAEMAHQERKHEQEQQALEQRRQKLEFEAMSAKETIAVFEESGKTVPRSLLTVVREYDDFIREHGHLFATQEIDEFERNEGWIDSDDARDDAPRGFADNVLADDGLEEDGPPEDCLEWCDDDQVPDEEVPCVSSDWSSPHGEELVSESETSEEVDYDVKKTTAWAVEEAPSQGADIVPTTYMDRRLSQSAAPPPPFQKPTTDAERRKVVSTKLVENMLNVDGSISVAKLEALLFVLKNVDKRKECTVKCLGRDRMGKGREIVYLEVDYVKPSSDSFYRPPRPKASGPKPSWKKAKKSNRARP